MIGPGQATSHYEAWVRALRLWQEDPNVDLLSLPPLTEDSLPPASWDRFMEHLSVALRTALDRWAEAFVTRLSREQDDFRRGAAMVDARRVLAKRLLLGRHPGLPEKLREAAWDVIADNIRDSQEQLEKAAQRGGRGIDAMRDNRDLKFFREHALTVLLSDGFPLESFAAGHHAAPAAVAPSAPAPTAAATIGGLPAGLGISRPRSIRL